MKRIEKDEKRPLLSGIPKRIEERHCQTKWSYRSAKTGKARKGRDSSARPTTTKTVSISASHSDDSFEPCEILHWNDNLHRYDDPYRQSS
jgi:hypothetical protein